MLEITGFLVFIIIVLFRPRVIPYMALVLFFIIGLAYPGFLDQFKVAFGGVNVYPTDLLYLLAVIYFLVYFVKVFAFPEFKNRNAGKTKTSAALILLFCLFYFGKFANAVFSGVAFDASVRMFMTDTQLVYFVMPLVIFKEVREFKSLMYFLTILALIFPLCQPFLAHSQITQSVMKGMGGTLRLGYGDANVILAFGVIALFSWNYKKYLSFLPLAGIMMLAHRSGYIAIFIAFIALSVVQGKKIKTLAVMGVSGIMMLGMLAALQSMTDVKILEKNLSRAEETFQQTGTTKARLDTIPLIFEEFQERPLTGFTYQEFHQLTVSRTGGARALNITHPHNFFLTTIVNSGLIGVIFIFLLMGRTLLVAHRLSKTADLAPVGGFLLSGNIFFIVYSLMNTTLETAGHIYWFLCGTTYWFYNEYLNIEKKRSQVA